MTDAETDDEDFPNLVRILTFAADTAVFMTVRAGGTTVECTRAAVHAALECGLGNKMISIVPSDQWPTFVAVDPPYIPTLPGGQT